MKLFKNFQKNTSIWFFCGLISTLIFSCTTPKVDSFEGAYRVLKESLLPQISIEQATISDAVAQGYSIKKLAEPLPNLEDFPLYGAKPSTDSNIASELQSPQVNSVFDKFQNQVLITTLTTLELKDIFIRNNQKLQAFPLQYQSYQTLKKLPGFEDVVFIPFGVANDNPLVGFSWNTAAQNEALRRFSEFALSPEMQQLAKAQGFNADEAFKGRVLPPIPDGAVLQGAQSYWKQRKDGGRTVNLMMVIDTSGSMEGDRLQSVKNSLRIAAQSINPGNYVGLVAFSDRPRQILPLAPFDTQQHKRLLAAADSLTADGGTAMYDGMIVGLSELMERQKTDPNGRFYLLLLTDGEVNIGLRFNEITNVLKYSGVRFYPIGYGQVNQNELQEIAKLRETTVKSSDPQKLQTLFTELFQTNL